MINKRNQRLLIITLSGRLLLSYNLPFLSSYSSFFRLYTLVRPFYPENLELTTQAYQY